MREARHKWGKVRVRPQMSIPGFLSYRQNINDRMLPLFHDRWQQIMNWSPIIPSSIGDVAYNDIIFINNEEELELMAKHLKECSEIAFDTEGHSEESYLGMICLLQISTFENNYVVDCLTLFDQIRRFLNDIFSNPDIHKIVHGGEDCTAMQRDFEIFCEGIIDMQEIYYYRHGIKQIAFSKMVEQYYQVKLNKTCQLADWRVRPLPTDLLQYASDDSRYLFNCYQKLKNEIGVNVIMERGLVDSKKIASKLYKFPLKPSAQQELNRYQKKFRSASISVFKHPLEENIFHKLLELRSDESKNIDILPKSLISTDKLVSLSREQPNCLLKFNSIVKGTDKYLSERFRQDILKEIERTKSKSVIRHEKEVDWTTDSPPPMLDSSLNKQSSYYSCEDWDCMEEETNNSLTNSKIDKEVYSIPKQIEAVEMEVDLNKGLNDKPVKKKVKRGRSGKLGKIKRLFTNAYNMGLTKEDILNNIDKYPKNKKT